MKILYVEDNDRCGHPRHFHDAGAWSALPSTAVMMLQRRERSKRATSGREQMQQHAWAKPDLLDHLVGNGEQ